MKNIKEYLAGLEKRDLVLAAAACLLIISTAAVFLISFGKSNTITIDGDDGQEESEVKDAKEDLIYVDIGGCVKSPGVYELEAGMRIFNVIEKAGGLTPKADTSSINQAEEIKDGMKIMIPSKEAKAKGSGAVQGLSSSGEKDGRININTADAERLKEIPGVGDVTAAKIISYREENGSFKTIEGLKDVNGIGDKTFEKMKDIITV